MLFREVKEKKTRYDAPTTNVYQRAPAFPVNFTPASCYADFLGFFGFRGANSELRLFGVLPAEKTVSSQRVEICKKNY